MEKKIKQTILKGYDPLLGYAYNSANDLPLKDNEKYTHGLVFIGDRVDCDIRIAILGGSTSDISYDGSWLREFHKTLKLKGLNPLLISAAVSGYATIQELMKLIRDVIPLEVKPDIVISLSGVNDTGFIQASSPESPTLHKYQKNIGEFIVKQYGDEKQKDSYFNHKIKANSYTPVGMNNKYSIGKLVSGLKSNQKPEEHWFQTIRMQKALCNEFGIQYLSFLQPIFNIGKYNSSDVEHTIYKEFLQNHAGIHTREYQETVSDFYIHARDIVKNNQSFMFDLVDIFENEENVYLDIRHPNQKGNTILAVKIAETLTKQKIIN